MSKNKNPTLFTLLQNGAKITFPDNFWLRGKPGDVYIQIGHEDKPMGLWTLDLAGMRRALRDLDDLRKEMKKASERR